MRKYFLLLLIVSIAAILRFYEIDSIPPALYVDEISIGYNASQIFHTGHDEYGTPHPLVFRSLDDYKMPVYIYLTAASIGIFGNTELAVRFPSVLFGTIAIAVFYFFLREIITYTSFSTKQKYYFPFIAASLLAVSPWHLQFSRGGFEVNVALTFYLIASYFALIYKRKQATWSIFLSFLFYTLSIYTYHTYRIIAPITLCILVFVLFKNLKKQRKVIISTAIFFLLTLIPLMLFTFGSNGFVRFAQTSTFTQYDKEAMQTKYILFPLVVIKNFLSFFSFSFLFNTGDGFGRHQIVGFGPIARWELPFLIIGIFSFFKMKRTLFFNVFLTFFILAPLPAALGIPSPHTLRTLLLSIPMMTVITIGLITFFSWTKKYFRLALCILVLVAAYETGYYLHYYYVHYPQTNILDWGGAYKQMVQEAEKYRSDHRIIVEQNLDNAKLYFEFYDHTLPFEVVPVGFFKPTSWGNQKVLFIRPNYETKNSPQVIQKIHLPDRNDDVFAEFWEL